METGMEMEMEIKPTLKTL